MCVWGVTDIFYVYPCRRCFIPLLRPPPALTPRSLWSHGLRALRLVGGEGDAREVYEKWVDTLSALDAREFVEVVASQPRLATLFSALADDGEVMHVVGQLLAQQGPATQLGRCFLVCCLEFYLVPEGGPFSALGRLDSQEGAVAVKVIKLLLAALAGAGVDLEPVVGPCLVKLVERCVRAAAREAEPLGYLQVWWVEGGRVAGAGGEGLSKEGCVFWGDNWWGLEGGDLTPVSIPLLHRYTIPQSHYPTTPQSLLHPLAKEASQLTPSDMLHTHTFPLPPPPALAPPRCCAPSSSWPTPPAPPTCPLAAASCRRCVRSWPHTWRPASPCSPQCCRDPTHRCAGQQGGRAGQGRAEGCVGQSVVCGRGV